MKYGMITRYGLIAAAFALACSMAQATVQENLTPDEQLLVLQHRKQAMDAQESPALVKQGAEYATEFAEACKAFLSTFDQGTQITIERLNQFMATPAGKFTIAMVGWKVLGKDAISITTGIGQTILGIFLLLPYVLWIRFIYRHFVTGKRICVSKEKGIKKYEWIEPPAKSQLTADSYVAWSMISVVATAVFTIVLLVLIF